MKMFVNRPLVTLAAAMCFLLFMAFPSLAQEAAQQPAPAPISDAELGSAAEAYLDIVKISEEFQQSIQGVEGQNERVALQEEANKQMLAAIEEVGLDVATYNNIIAQVRSNEEVREKFMEKVR